MKNNYNQLKDELSALYPEFTDEELTKTTDNLIAFYTTAVRAVLDKQKVSDVNDKNFKDNGDFTNEENQ